MLLRVLLALSIALAPFAELRATEAETPELPGLLEGTRVTAPDVGDWIVEGLAASRAGNKDRARVLFEAARDRLNAEKIPRFFLQQILARLNPLIVEAGGQARGPGNGDNAAQGQGATNLGNLFTWPENGAQPAGRNAAQRNGVQPNAPADRAGQPNTSAMGRQSVTQNQSPETTPGRGQTERPARRGGNDFGDLGTTETETPLAFNCRPVITPTQSGLGTTGTGSLTNAQTPQRNAQLNQPRPGSDIDPSATFMIRTGDMDVLRRALSGSAEDGRNIRTLLWWVSAGRMAWAAKSENLCGIIARTVPDTNLNTYDSFGGFGGGGGGFGWSGGGMIDGPIYDVLMRLGIISRDYFQTTLALLQTVDGSRITDIVNQYIWDGATYNAILSASASLLGNDINRVGPRIEPLDGFGRGFNDFDTQSPGRGRSGAMKALEILKVGNLASHMSLISRTYGIRNEMIDGWILGIFFYGLVKWFLKQKRATSSVFGRNARSAWDTVKELRDDVKSFGKRFMNISMSRGRDAGNGFIRRRTDELIDDLADPSAATIANVGQGTVSDRRAGRLNQRGAADPVQNDDDDAARRRGGQGQAEPDTDHSRRNGGGTMNDPDPDPHRPRRPRRPPTPRTPAQNIMALGEAGFHGAIGFGEAFAILWVGSWFFEGAYEAQIEAQNKAFLRLLNTPKGLPFLKLLAQAHALGRDRIPAFNLGENPSPQMQFILNLARSAGVCSADDYRLAERTKNQDIEAVEPSVRQRVRQIRYSCLLSPSTENFDALQRELATFNAIDDESVALLRASPIRLRLRMAQIMIQFMFVPEADGTNGDQNRDEAKFFHDVTSKILGIVTAEQVNYLQNYAASIRQAGGMVPNERSATGFMVNTSRERMESPNDNRRGLVGVNAPADMLILQYDNDALGPATGNEFDTFGRR